MNAVVDYLRANQKRFVAELCDYVRFPSVSAQPAHGKDMAACAEVSFNITGDGDPERVTAGTRDVADWSALADEEVLRAQMKRRLVGALQTLPVIYRTPVILRDLHGMTTEEASTKLGIKEQTLKSRLHRGRLFADGARRRGSGSPSR